MARWGIVSTIKAPATDILRFAAYHLEQGAHRLFICLDAPCPEAKPHLKAHPKIRVITCNGAHWHKLNGERPAMHQPRQTLNATHIYHRAQKLDWLIHMDVDEFLVANSPIATQLATLPADTLTARARPMELLAGGTTAFKRFIPAGPARSRIVADLYPTFGEHLKGGFLSHIAGKLFVRTGLDNLKLRIHNAFVGPDMIKAEAHLGGIDLAHCHAHSWENWQSQFQYRLNEGSYRASLGPAKSRERGGLTMHELFQTIIEDQGEAGLRAFYDEVCADTPALRARLSEQGLLSEVDLNLEATVAKHFPQFSGV